MRPSWKLDETVHAGQEHLDPAFVAGFDRKQGYPDPASDIALLDERGVAVDVSPAMIDYLRSRAESAGVALELAHAGFVSYEHQGEPVDAVYTRHALHQLPDFWKVVALHRIARILRPGGVLRLRDLVYDFPSAATEQVMDRWVSGGVADPGGGVHRRRLRRARPHRAQHLPLAASNTAPPAKVDLGVVALLRGEMPD